MLSPQRRTLTLTTIPGQVSRSRYYAIEEFFGSQTNVARVIFVACNGRDRIWPQNADLVANNLARLDLTSLVERNRREELENFREICDRIIQKYFMAPHESCPRWLLTVVNKLDLYWSDRAQAAAYYLPGSGSEFDKVAQELLRRVGTNNLNYFTIPLATEPSNYRFDSSLGRIDEMSQLTADQCRESVACLMETLGDLVEQSRQ